MTLDSSFRFRQIIPAFLIFLVSLLLSVPTASAADGDTIKVRPIEFKGNQSVYFQCPPKSVKYQKVQIIDYL
mgnify:FL=1